MASFLNYIIESSIQPVKTNVLWIKDGIPYYYNKKWKPLLAGGSGGGSGGGSDCPIQFGEGENSAVLKFSNSKALNDYSLALGYNTISNNRAEVSFGQYNKSVLSNSLSEATLFSIGNGTKDKPKNALEIKYDGSLFIQNLDKSVQESFESLLKKQAYFDSSITELETSIGATESKLRNEYTLIAENLEGSIVELNSTITQTADAIRLEVTETTKGLNDRIDKNASSITQTAEEIRFEVSKSIETLDGKINENSTSISQTAESITALASKTEELENKNVEYDSKFVQTAEQIEAVVGRVETTEESIKNVNSSISQTAEAIRVEVAEEVETLSGEIEKNTSSITQTSNTINLRVDTLEGSLNSKTGELEGKITKNTSDIALNKEQIALKVNSDVFDTLSGTVAQQGTSIELNTNAIKTKVEQEEFDALSGSVESGFTEVDQTISGINTTIGNHSGQLTTISVTIEGLTAALGKAEADIDSLKKQSDGSIETHFGTQKPTLNNLPASEWTTEDIKREHTGDVYYNNITGEAYRFSYDPDTKVYFWVELTDSALTDALDKISKLEEAVDGKVTIFYTTPSNYKEGDLWFVDRTYEATETLPKLSKGQLVTAKVSNTTFNRADWEDRTNFASKEELESSINQLDTYIDGAFKDGILEEAEISQILEFKKSFELTFSEITESYNILLISSVATETNKSAITTAYNNLNTGYTELIQSIDDLVKGTGTLQNYKNKYNTFLNQVKNYYKESTSYTNLIQSSLLSLIDNLSLITSDGVLTSSEKVPLFNTWKNLAEEFNSNRSIALNYKIIELNNGVYQKRTDIYEDDTYWLVYKNYQDAFIPVQEFFTASIDGKSVLGFDAMHENTTLPDDFDITSISSALEVYYAKLALFAEMISKITIEITDAHDKAIKDANKLSELLQPQDNISVIGKGVILSSVIAVQSNNTIQAGLNATNLFKDNSTTNNHGKIVFAGGINGAEDWNNAKTVIYEDGYVHFRWGEIDEGVEIGNALIRSVVSGTIDLFSYPENGTLVPLFIVNKDNTGKIVSISTPYDFIANKNLIVHGDTTSGGENDPSTVVGATSVIVDGKSYPAKDGVIDMTAAFENLQEEIDLTNYYTKPEADQQINNAITALNIGQYLKSATAESTYAKITSLTAVDNRLKGIEAYFATSEDAGTQIDKWNEIVAFLDATEGTTLAGILEAYTLKSVYEAFVSSTNTALADRYTKAEIESKVSALNTAIALKANASDVYTKTQVDGKVETINTALADRYTKAQVDGIVTTINNSISSVDNKYAPTKTWADTLASLIVNENGNIRIKTNLIVNGDTASGGSGGSSAVGITGILLNGVTYRDENSDGIIDLGTITSGLTSVDWSDVKNKPTFGTLAYKNGLAASDVGALSTAGGTIKSTTDGAPIHLETTTQKYCAISFKGNVGGKAYLLYSGETDEWAVTTANWANTYTLYHTGNFNPADYLPLSGGTITGNLVTKSHLITHEVYPAADNTYELGNNSRRWANIKTVLINGGTPIHSENIGSYKAGDSDKLGNIDARYYMTSIYNTQLDINSRAFDVERPYILRVGSSNANLPAGMQYGNIAHFSTYGNDTAYELFGAYSNQKLLFRCGESSSIFTKEWKTIAFTDSNVAAAYKLVDASGNNAVVAGASYTTIYGDLWLWEQGNADRQIKLRNNLSDLFNTLKADGSAEIFVSAAAPLKLGTANTTRMLINSSGNVTIGGSDLASTNYQLYVNDKIGAGLYYFAKNKTNYGYIGLASSANNDITISTDATSKLWLNGNGNTIMNYYGGNVLIGTTTDGGAKLQVDGIVRGKSAFEFNASGHGIRIGSTFSESLTDQDVMMYGNGLYFYAGSTRKMSILNSGNVLIGTTTDTGNGEKLQVNGSVIASALSGTDRYFLAENSARSISLRAGTASVGLYADKVAKWLIYLTDTNETRIPNPTTIGGATTINGDLRVNGNLVVTGDTASGGGSGSATVGSIVTFSPTYTSGLSIGSISIDGTSKSIYVPTATASSYGVVKPNNVRSTAISATVGGTTSGRYYGVEMDSNGKLFVNVPWTASTGGGSGSADCGYYPPGFVDLDSINGYEVVVYNGDVLTSERSGIVTLDFTRVRPNIESAPCVIYILKMATPHTLSVPVYSSSGIVMLNQSTYQGATATMSVPMFAGLMLIWNPGRQLWNGFMLH